MISGVICGGGVLSILGGAHATGREAVIYTALGLAALTMVVNLWIQKPETGPLRENVARTALQQAG